MALAAEVRNLFSKTAYSPKDCKLKFVSAAEAAKPKGPWKPTYNTTPEQWKYLTAMAKAKWFAAVGYRGDAPGTK
jgi:hypothetical protein